MRIKVRLAALMKERNMNENELNKRTGVARNTIRAMARDANTRVDFEVVEKIAAALGVRPLELFEETETPRGPRKPVLQAA